MALSEEKIAELKAKHGDVHLLTSGDVELVVRRPSRPEYGKFRSDVGDPKRKDIALESLMRTVIVHPERKDFSEMLEHLPGLCEEFSEQMMELVGITQKATAAKL